MIFAGLVFSAVVIFLGIFTKLPQGGGGLVNNLMVMSCFLSSPPLLPSPPPPRAIFLDLDEAIFGTREYYLLHPTTIGKVTHRPMPRTAAKPRPAAASSSPFPPPNATFAFPDFWLPLKFFQLCLTIVETIGNIAIVFLALSLSWLAAQQMHRQGTTVTARKAAGKPITTRLGEQLMQIQPYCQVLAVLQTIISERDQTLAELVQAKKQAKEADKGALEVEEAMQVMHKDSEDALEELARGKEIWEKLEKEKEREAKRLKGEMKRQAKAWEEKEREWEVERAREKKISQENKDSRMMGREREREGWKWEVEMLVQEGGRGGNHEDKDEERKSKMGKQGGRVCKGEG